jgi:hypothetical protein
MHSDGQGRMVLSFYQVLCLIGFYKGIVTLPTGDGRRCSWAASRPTTTLRIASTGREARSGSQPADSADNPSGKQVRLRSCS